jgi:hypothetical protein
MLPEGNVNSRATLFNRLIEIEKPLLAPLLVFPVELVSHFS